MSTQAKIHCFNCDVDYYVYWDGISKDKVINCPHCDATIDEHMWGQIVHAMGCVQDVNYHFAKYHEERNEDFFQISIENHYVPTKKFRL